MTTKDQKTSTAMDTALAGARIGFNNMVETMAAAYVAQEKESTHRDLAGKIIAAQFVDPSEKLNKQQKAQLLKLFQNLPIQNTDDKKIEEKQSKPKSKTSVAKPVNKTVEPITDHRIDAIVALIRKNNYEKAATKCDGFISNNTGNHRLVAVVYALRAYAYQQSSNPKQAILDYAEAMTFRSETFKADFESYGLVMNFGEFAGLLDRLDKEPNNAFQIKQQINKLIEERYPAENSAEVESNEPQIATACAIVSDSKTVEATVQKSDEEDCTAAKSVRPNHKARRAAQRADKSAAFWMNQPKATSPSLLWGYEKIPSWFFGMPVKSAELVDSRQLMDVKTESSVTLDLEAQYKELTKFFL